MILCTFATKYATVNNVYIIVNNIYNIYANASVELALNRERWRDLLVAAQALQGPLS